jgi:hypothetical protein
MRVIVAGSRKLNAQWIDGTGLVESAVKDSGFGASVIVSTGADGIGTYAERYAMRRDLPLLIYKPDWEKYGKAAARRRNVRMARNADALVAIRDGTSRNAKYMIQTARIYGLKSYVQKVNLATYRPKPKTNTTHEPNV